MRQGGVHLWPQRETVVWLWEEVENAVDTSVTTLQLVIDGMGILSVGATHPSHDQRSLVNPQNSLKPPVHHGGTPNHILQTPGRKDTINNGAGELRDRWRKATSISKPTEIFAAGL